MQDASETIFWQFDTGFWFQKLGSSAAGLSQGAATKILIQKGLHPKSQSAFKNDLILFVKQFKSPIMLLMIGAVALSAFLGETSDVMIILAIVLSSGTLSFYQERNAGRVVEKLKSMISIKSTVLRDGIPQEIVSKALVPGDVIVLNAGDLIPADCILIEADELHANESSLTGESFPTRKEVAVVGKDTEMSKRINCLWEGTNIVSGTGKALVILTGDDTLFGAIARSAGNVVETTFEKGI